MPTNQDATKPKTHDALLRSLDNAIEEAYNANQKARAALEKAIKGAYRGGLFEDDYRYKYAHQMLKACLRVHNIGARYAIKEVSIRHAEERRAARNGKGR